MMTSKIEIRPSELLRLWRERAGLTQWRAAALLGVSQTVLCDVERGRRAPTADFVDRAREAYRQAES